MSRRWIVAAALALLGIWLVSAVTGARLLLAPPDLPRSDEEWILALVIFGVGSTTVWLGIVALALVIAWKRWSRGPDAKSESKSRAPGAPSLCLLALLTCLVGACTAGGPDVVPMDEARVSSAEARWRAAGPRAYRQVVRTNAAKVDPVFYEIVVRDGVVSTAMRNGQTVPAEQAWDYTVVGLFELMRSELELVALDDNGLPNVRAELFARFDPATGHLVRYKRGTARRVTGLRIEVLEFSAP